MGKHQKGLRPLFWAFVLAFSCSLLSAPALAAKTEYVMPEQGSMDISIGRDGLAPIKAVVGKSFIMRTGNMALKRVSVSDPTVIDYTLLSPSELYMLPKRYGTTNITLWTKDGKTAVLDLNVEIDTDELQDKIAELLPGETNIRVTSAAKSIVLQGSVSSPVALDQVLDIADAYVRYLNRDIVLPIVAGGGEVGPGTKVSIGSTNLRQARNVAGVSVINMLSVAEPMQVLLEVKVAEVTKGLLEQLGAAVGKCEGDPITCVGQATITNSSHGDIASASLLSQFLAAAGGNLANGLVTVTIGDTILRINGEKGDDIFRLLAEPNIMAISGQEGAFLSGGTVWVNTAFDDNGNAIAEEVDFGVRLKFLPTVLANGRINLKVEPEVSEPSPVAVEGSQITFVKRKASTTVQLNDGQSFAIAGLIKSSVVESVNRYPVLGEIPILGALFRSSAFQESKTELMFVVTPRLVKPLPPNYKLPTDFMQSPDRAQFFLGGQMEGQKSAPAAAPAPAPSKANPDNLRMN